MPQNSEKREAEYASLKKSHWLLLLVSFVSSLFVVQYNALDLRVSVTSPATAPAYDGTVLPIQTSPKWTKLSSDQWDASYSAIPSDKMQPLPTYDPQQLKTPTEQLGWSDPAHLKIRDAKITFSVPYMGNYTLDGQEYGGSHLAVDIKLPYGTPVYAIGNGVATKVSQQSTGFGNHIVVEHKDFPSFSTPSAKETYYSSYSHLSEVLIAEGSVVLKGQLIGRTGESGTATTPHLHFQIDNSKAPWHPYWPFTFQEATAAGLNFTSAINAGLGKEKALETTINPMMYVQKYLSGSIIASETPATPVTPPPSTTETTNADLPPVLTTDAPEVETPPLAEVVAKPAVKFQMNHPDIFTKGVTETITVTAIDEDGVAVANYKPPHDLYVQVLLGGADVPDKVPAVGFQDGVAKFTITPTADAGLQLKVTDNEITGESGVMRPVMFHDVDKNADYFPAVSFLKEHEVIGGYPDGTFKPDAVVSRVEALKFILKGINSDLLAGSNLPFPDTSGREWYSTYVATAYDRSIVRGYPDNTFRPANTVNRAEFLKMLLEAMDVEIPQNVTRDVYHDVPKDAWFAPYVQFAKDKNLLVLKDRGFKPEEGMTRAEVAELIYRVIMLKVSGMERYSSGIRVSDGDVRAFFS